MEMINNAIYIMTVSWLHPISKGWRGSAFRSRYFSSCVQKLFDRESDPAFLCFETLSFELHATILSHFGVIVPVAP